MTTYNVVSPGAMVAGQAEDISVILSNFQAIAAVLNGNLDNSNLAPGAAIVPSKLAGYPALSSVFLRGDGAWAAAGDKPSQEAFSNVSAANTDAPAPVSSLAIYEVSAGGGTLRSVGAPVSTARLVIRNWEGSSAFTILDGDGGVPLGNRLNVRGAGNIVLSPGDSIEFFWDGTWQEIDRNVANVGAMTLIQEIIRQTDGTIDFTGIPQIYKHLRLEVMACGTNGGNSEQLVGRLNNLSGASDYMSRGANVTDYNNRGFLGVITGGNMYGSNGISGHVVIEIPYYKEIKKHAMMGHYDSKVDNAGNAASDFSVGDQDSMFISGSLGAVTQITLFGHATANLKTSSRAALYGIV